MQCLLSFDIILLLSSECKIVYDFQESPTGELVDYSFSAGAESTEQESSEECTSDYQLQMDPALETDAQSCETFCVPEETHRKNLEEGKAV